MSGDIRAPVTTTTVRRNLKSAEFLQKNQIFMRNLQAATSTTTLEEKLKNPTDIEISLHAYIDSNGATTDSLTSFINLNREYLTRWNPINGTLNNETIFEIPALSYALVTMDLRGVQDQYSSFTYYEDWGISFTIGNDITVDSRAQPAEMPEMFLRKTSKNQVLEFQIFAWK